LTYSIKDHLIPNVSELKTLKEMFDALTRIYESNNTNRKLTLRHQLKNVTMNKSETIANYFMRISQIKDQLEAIGDSVEDVETHDYYTQWISLLLGSIYSRDLCQKKISQVQQAMGRLHPRGIQVDIQIIED
jgi:hypothetical protein